MILIIYFFCQYDNNVNRKRYFHKSEYAVPKNGTLVMSQIN
jgi:hypothetical protein